MNTCGTCVFRSVDGWCDSTKLSDRRRLPANTKHDMLFYSYEEGGGFWVGKDFGCVHWSAMTEEKK